MIIWLLNSPKGSCLEDLVLWEGGRNLRAGTKWEVSCPWGCAFEEKVSQPLFLSLSGYGISDFVLLLNSHGLTLSHNKP